ncbi:MAG: Na+/H+ antiporter, partial [Gorillibacterium sp.]|nr:Na+/H+ antiporter [Gorillibacterium sp.]
LERMLQAKETTPFIAEKLGDLLDHTEVILARGFDSQFRISLLEVKRFFFQLFSSEQSEDGEIGCLDINRLREAKISTAQAAIKAILHNRSKDNYLASGQVISRYKQVISRLKGKLNDPDQSEFLDEQRLELKIKAIQEQRDTVQDMFENGIITREIASSLRRFVADIEASLVKED